MSKCDLSIIIPTFNEKANILKLVDKLNALPFGNNTIHIVVVDDNSPDKTWKIVDNARATIGNLTLVRRVGRKGLSSAALEGILIADSTYVAVIDGDMQHDETILPKMLNAAIGGADLVVGTRYSGEENSSVGNWSKKRVFMSKLATRLSKLAIKHNLSDPMSGFFLIKRELILEKIENLSNSGFKILLDIVSNYNENELVTVEVPYTFKSRVAGESKLSHSVAFKYIEFLYNKTFGRYLSIQFFKFALVGASGALLHFILLYSFHKILSFDYEYALIIAIATATLSNYIFNNFWTFKDYKLYGIQLMYGFLKYMLFASFGGAINFIISTSLISNGFNWVVASILGAVAGVLWNYLLNKVFTWNVGKI